MNTAKTDHLETIPEGCITLTSKDDAGALHAGSQITALLYVTKDTNVWEITPTNMPPGSDVNLEIHALMSLSSELADTESTLHMTDGK